VEAEQLPEVIHRVTDKRIEKRRITCFAPPSASPPLPGGWGFFEIINPDRVLPKVSLGKNPVRVLNGHSQGLTSSQALTFQME